MRAVALGRPARAGAWREAMANFFDIFPDAAYTLNDLFFAGDKGVWRGNVARHAA